MTALLILTSCNPYAGLITPTQEPTVTATATAQPPASGRLTPSPTPQTCTVQTNVPQGSLNIRAGVGVGFAVLEVLHEGQILTLTHQPARDGWIEVTAGSVTGWINSTYCKIGE